MIKHICALILVLSFLLPFAGCTMTEEYPPPMELSDDMPPAPAEDEETESFEATLYFLSSDKKDFKTENRIVSYGGGISRAQAIVDALADGPKNNATYRSVPSWMTLTRIEQSGDVCNLYFEGQFLPEDETWLKLRACVAASLMATEDIKTVNTRFFEMERGCYGYPLGAAEVSEDLSLHVRSTKNEYASYHTFGSGIMIDEDTEYLTDTATLYFPVSGEKLLAARGVEITYPERITKSELAEVLIEALAAGDPQQQYENPLPEGFSFRFYRDGDRETWIGIEQSAREFASREEGLEAWARYYGGREAELNERMLFLQNAGEREIGTATAFYDVPDGDPAGDGWLHWVAIRREAQGQGLSKPLVARALGQLKALGYYGGEP